MSEKRKREDQTADIKPHKKTKHGFRVGPANLPDSTYKRHNDKIKKGLIERAQIKKQYAKVKRQFDAQEDVKRKQHPSSVQVEDSAVEDVEVNHDASSTTKHIPTTTPHPDRVDLMNNPVASTNDDRHQTATDRSQVRRQRKPRPNAFSRETQKAERRRQEAEARRAAREEADRQRQEKIADRERFRKAMAKARTPDGQRKLGRESTVLLAKVKRMVGV